MRAGGAGGNDDLLLGRTGNGVRDVVADAVGEQERVLEHHPDLAAERRQRDVSHVDAVDRHPATAHVVEAGDQRRHRRLARPADTDERHHLTGVDVEIEPRQHRLGPVVAERDVLEGDRAADRGEVDRTGSVGDRGGGVEHVEQSFGSGAGLLADGEQTGQHPDRGDELHQIRRERQEGADRDVTVDRQVPAEREDGDLGEARDGLQRRGVAGVEADQPAPRREQ